MTEKLEPNFLNGVGKNKKNSPNQEIGGAGGGGGLYNNSFSFMGVKIKIKMTIL